MRLIRIARESEAADLIVKIGKRCGIDLNKL